MNTDNATHHSRARLTGLVYLCYFVTAIGGVTLGKKDFIIAGHMVDIISILCYLAVTVLFYRLFEPVQKSLSLIAALFSATGCVLTALNTFHVTDAATPLLFFGPYCILLGLLIARSTFLPRFLGIVLVIAGLGWVLLLLSPPELLSLITKGFGFLSELSLMLWLLIKGVDEGKWLRLQ